MTLLVISLKISTNPDTILLFTEGSPIESVIDLSILISSICKFDSQFKFEWPVPKSSIAIDIPLLLNKEIKGFVPSDVANEIVNEIRNHFAHNHYIVYSSVNTISKIQILQNERFAVNIKLNSEEEVEEAIAFNDNINSKDRHATRVLKMI